MTAIMIAITGMVGTYVHRYQADFKEEQRQIVTVFVSALALIAVVVSLLKG